MYLVSRQYATNWVHDQSNISYPCRIINGIYVFSIFGSENAQINWKPFHSQQEANQKILKIINKYSFRMKERYIIISLDEFLKISKCI